jgi:WD40-like Beta Propeller Repeat
MEPFISRDGKYLFFNNSNAAPTTKLYWATQIDPLTFQFQGEIGGVNTAMLDAVPSMDLSGNFYFISTRSYAQNLSTVYRGVFANGNVSAIGPVPGISAPMTGLVDFDEEISADGNTLYFTEGELNGSGPPKTAQIIVATRGAGSFARSPQSATIMQQINTNTLNYAADTSASELELFFTRLDPAGPAIYSAARPDAAVAFGTPTKIAAITGFVEAPSLSPDGKSLYYHKKESQFVVYRVTRP